MNLKNAIVCITGASSGIGYACAEKFAEGGSRLLLCARRKDRLEKLAAYLANRFGVASYIMKLDVRDQQLVEKTIAALPDEWKAIEVLVNNAGLSRGLDKLHEGKIQDWDEMIDTNVKGLLYVSRAVIPGMVERRRGTIVNIGSIAGHEVYPGGNVYCASKHAVDAITKGMRIDLVDTPVRVCSVDPGLVETEFSMVRFRGDVERAKRVYENLTPLTPADVADAVYYCVSRPPHVQIADMILLATAQATSTLVHRMPKE